MNEHPAETKITRHKKIDGSEGTREYELFNNGTWHAIVLRKIDGKTPKEADPNDIRACYASWNGKPDYIRRRWKGLKGYGDGY
jgi:hypothetical protein